MADEEWEDPYSEDEDEPSEEDEEYWDLDELGIDPEEIPYAAAHIQPGADRQPTELQPHQQCRLAV
jgi:hypothetical protein